MCIFNSIDCLLSCIFAQLSALAQHNKRHDEAGEIVSILLIYIKYSPKSHEKQVLAKETKNTWIKKNTLNKLLFIFNQLEALHHLPLSSSDFIFQIDQLAGISLVSILTSHFKTMRAAVMQQQIGLLHTRVLRRCLVDFSNFQLLSHSIILHSSHKSAFISLVFFFRFLKIHIS